MAQRVLSVLLVAVGLLAPLGHALEWETLRGVAHATVASPLPLVFSSFRGVETFALEFRLEVVSADGARVSRLVTPREYGRLDGPYNRRNTYGAVVSYGAAFESEREKATLRSVLRHGLCDGGPLATRLELPTTIQMIEIHIRPHRRDDTRSWTLTVPCHD